MSIVLYYFISPVDACNSGCSCSPFKGTVQLSEYANVAVLSTSVDGTSFEAHELIIFVYVFKAICVQFKLYLKYF